MSREPKSLAVAVSLSGLVTLGSTFPLWRDVGEAWGLLLLLSLPGAVFAFPLGAMVSSETRTIQVLLSFHPSTSCSMRGCSIG